MIKKLAIVSLALLIVGCTGRYSSNYQPVHKIDFPTKRVATGKKTFIFNPRHLAWAAYDEDGFLVRTGAASGGSDACPEDGADCRTVTGEFRVQRKGNSDCKSSKYPLGEGGAPMAYCMHFHEGYAIHGAPGTPSWHNSHGCIRVSNSDARWLNKDFLNVGSTVIVKPY